jgi:hypothetical protein
MERPNDKNVEDMMKNPKEDAKLSVPASILNCLSGPY